MKKKPAKVARALSKNATQIAKTIGDYLHDKYNWNIFGKSKCNKCEKVNFVATCNAQFCARCGTKLEFIEDEETCKEIYEAYCKGKKVDENCS